MACQQLLQPPHEQSNIVTISAWKNAQKTPKPNPDVTARLSTYWDLNSNCGFLQKLYNERLEALPNEGHADTVSIINVFCVHVWDEGWMTRRRNISLSLSSYIYSAFLFVSCEFYY